MWEPDARESSANLRRRHMLLDGLQEKRSCTAGYRVREGSRGGRGTCRRV